MTQHQNASHDPHGLSGTCAMAEETLAIRTTKATPAADTQANRWAEAYQRSCGTRIRPDSHEPLTQCIEKAGGREKENLNTQSNQTMAQSCRLVAVSPSGAIKLCANAKRPSNAVSPAFAFWPYFYDPIQIVKASNLVQ
jgi:molybdenum cofactor biosynthesis enzyme MoaA